MSKSKWTQKNENGDYIYYFMHHEVHDHGRTEEQAEVILAKYFGSEPSDWIKRNDS